jgi:hypothetical protein
LPSEALPAPNQQPPLSALSLALLASVRPTVVLLAITELEGLGSKAMHGDIDACGG